MATNVPDTISVCSPLSQEENLTHEAITPHPPQYSDIPGTVPLSQARTNCPPPSYDDVVNPEAPPPSYQSLFGQVREARKNSNGIIDFIRKIIIIFLGTVGCTVIIGVTFVIPISMMAVGASYCKDCPVEPYIPLYLVVGGVFGVIKNSLNFYSKCRGIRNGSSEENMQQRPHNSLLNCFLLAWYIAGCCWIYRVYEPEYEDITSPFYCNKTLYLFSFWLVTAVFIIIGLMSVCIMCFVASSVLND